MMKSEQISFKINFSKTSIILAVITLILNAIIIIIPAALMFKLYISLLVVVLLYYYMIKTTIQYRGVKNCFFMLLVLSIFFYYGQHLVAIFNSTYLKDNDGAGLLSGKIPDNMIIHATFIAIICMLILHAGFFSVKPISLHQCNANDINKCNKGLIKAGWIILLLSIYPTFKYLFALLELQTIYGYLGRRMMETEDNYLATLGIARWQILLANLFLPSIYALLIGYRGSGKSKWVYLLLAIYLLIYLFTGSRFMVLKALVIIALIQLLWIKPFKIYNVKIIIIAATVLAIVFSVGSLIRGYTKDSFNIEEVNEGLSLSGILWESGITFTTISNVLYCCPSKVDFFYGKSLLGSVLQCLPNIFRFGFFDHNVLSVSETFSPLYYGSGTDHGYGSSFIAEAYYNFGYLMFVYIFILGICLGKINQSLVKAYNNNSAYLFFCLVSLCGELVYGVRNDLSSIPRIMLTTTFVVLVLSLLLHERKIPKISTVSRIK